VKHVGRGCLKPTVYLNSIAPNTHGWKNYRGKTAHRIACVSNHTGFSFLDMERCVWDKEWQ